MSTNNIHVCFHGEIRKISILLSWNCTLSGTITSCLMCLITKPASMIFNMEEKNTLHRLTKPLQVLIGVDKTPFAFWQGRTKHPLHFDRRGQNPLTWVDITPPFPLSIELPLYEGTAKSFVTGFWLLQCYVLQTYFYYKPSKYSPFTETHICYLFTQSRKADK